MSELKKAKKNLYLALTRKPASKRTLAEANIMRHLVKDEDIKTIFREARKDKEPKIIKNTDKLMEEIKENVHYLKMLSEQGSFFQPEIRRAVTFALEVVRDRLKEFSKVLEG